MSNIINKIKLLAITITVTTAFAMQDITIVGGGGSSLPTVAIVNLSNNVGHIIGNDLTITGEFNIKYFDNAADALKNSNYILNGSISNGSATINLSDVTVESSIESQPKPYANNILSQKITINNNDSRALAHDISNTVYKKLTNTPGIFTSKIAYIMQSHKTFKIIVSDYDGYNAHILLTTNAPIISLNWNHDDTQITYTSYETGKPVVYVQDIYDKRRYIVADFNGSNSASVFTPDDKSLLVTLTKDYGSHIYIVNNKPYTRHSYATKIINYGEIDTEASVSTSNNAFVFTSDHDGTPQIFLSNLNDHNAITRETVNLGSYNVDANISHDAHKITFINRDDGILKAYVMDLSNQVSYPVSIHANSAQAPSFSPNDKLILFSSDKSMYVTNTTGTRETKLNKINANIIDQKWGNLFE